MVYNDKIVVPQRTIQGGFDMKFETDPYEIDLKGILTGEQYTDAMTSINDRLRPSRSGVIDKALLLTGPLLVPLALWGVRHSNQNRRRKRLLKKAIDEFNTNNPSLLMRWNRKPKSCLTIERRPEESSQPQPPPVAVAKQQHMVAAPTIGNTGPQNMRRPMEAEIHLSDKAETIDLV